MSDNVRFRAVVRTWAPDDTDAVVAALKAWAFEDEQFSADDVTVDVVGGGPRNPIVRIMAYSMTRVWISGSWARLAEERLRQRVTPAGGSDIGLEIEYPDGP